MSADLTACLAHTLSYEGGFVDDPRDPGGATIFGITLATLRTVQRNAKLGVAQLKALTRAQAEAIYSTSYYLPVRADQLPAGIDLMAGDMAVNAGCATAALILQEALGVEADGAIGPVTVAAAVAANPATVIAATATGQAMFYRGLTTFPVFGKGWLARVANRRTVALAMAAPGASAAA